MYRVMSRGLGLVAAASLVAGRLPAQTVDEIVAKYYQAAGGLEAMKAIHATRVSGTVTLAPGTDAPFTRITMRPSSVRVDFTVQGMVGTQAYDGQTAWMYMPFMGQTAPDTMPSSMAANMQEQSTFDGPLVDYAVRGIQIELLGKEQVDSVSAYKLKVTLPSGNVTYYYMDAERYLPLRTETTLSVQDKPLTVVSDLSDYRPEGGFMIPHKVNVVQGAGTASPATQFYLIQKVEINPPLTAADFRMPPKPGGDR
jgi:outer membrane lipoprotein-sorting protein